LTREEEPGLRDFYARLLAVRRELGHTEAGAVEHDEDERWLVVRRGEHTLACNFADREQVVPASGDLVLATHEATVESGGVRLPARAGALLR
jgi:maltooligosyltrehalose trehalohydrolase